MKHSKLISGTAVVPLNLSQKLRHVVGRCFLDYDHFCVNFNVIAPGLCVENAGLVLQTLKLRPFPLGTQ